MPQNETALMHQIMLALSERGCLIYRNNTGSIKTTDGRFVKFGLCVGSSDLIGIAPGGRFCAFEVKTDTGRATIEQKRFINAVIAAGGIAGIVRSPAEALALINRESKNEIGKTHTQDNGADSQQAANGRKRDQGKGGA